MSRHSVIYKYMRSIFPVLHQENKTEIHIPISENQVMSAFSKMKIKSKALTIWSKIPLQGLQTVNKSKLNHLENNRCML